MNIHEECLINYLQKPDELSHTTDVLKLNNALFAKKMKNKLFIVGASILQLPAIKTAKEMGLTNGCRRVV